MGNNKEEILSKLLLELWSIPSEVRTEELIEEINKLSPDPEWSNYMYHSDDFVGEGESLLVNALVKKILAYKPIIL